MGTRFDSCPCHLKSLYPLVGRLDGSYRGLTETYYQLPKKFVGEKFCSFDFHLVFFFLGKKSISRLPQDFELKTNL
jgi:hypothetical protein